MSAEERSLNCKHEWEFIENFDCGQIEHFYCKKCLSFAIVFYDPDKGRVAHIRHLVEENF